MRLHRTSLAAIAVLAATVLAACGDDDSTSDGGEPAAESAPESVGDATGEPAAVTIEQSRFEPDELTVAAGTEVTWENLDGFAHTVTSAEGSAAEFDSGELAQGETFSHTFDEAGAYDYFCQIHPTMRSTVVVE